MAEQLAGCLRRRSPMTIHQHRVVVVTEAIARFVGLHAAAFVIVLGFAAPASAQSLPHNIPDFASDTTRPTVRSVQSGSWSSASTWQGGAVPGANHVVHVDPGHTVTINDTAAAAYTLAIHGVLRFNPTATTRLTVTNLMVMGDHGMPTMTHVGHLEMGTPASPIAANVTAEIVIADTPLGSGVSDPEQYGTGLLNFGKVTMHGAIKTPTWLRVATEPRAGDTTLTLEAPVSGWRTGDRIVIPDTSRNPKSPAAAGSTRRTSGRN
jgi:hypothetical protein